MLYLGVLFAFSAVDKVKWQGECNQLASKPNLTNEQCRVTA